MRYLTTVEVKGYGQPVDEGEALEVALGEPEGLSFRIGVDEERGLVRLTMEFEASDGMDAHEQALGVWADAWEVAFPDADNVDVFRITATPGAIGDEGEATIEVAAGNADPLADLEEM